MSTITAAAIASLRARTGVSISACKDALVEAEGNEDKAIEILRKRGLAQAAKKAERDQTEGLIFMKQEGNKSGAVLLRCETDFVARDDNFQAAGNAIVHALVSEGEDAAKAIAAEKLPELVQKLGENITLGEMHLYDAPILGSYLHSNAKVGVMIALEDGTVEQARDVAMHAAAFSPSFVSPSEVSAEAVEKEKEIWAAQLAKEGKPAEIQEKIMMGKEKKFREESSLHTQPFAKDPSKTVEQFLGGPKVKKYVRVSVA